MVTCLADNDRQSSPRSFIILPSSAIERAQGTLGFIRSKQLATRYNAFTPTPPSDSIILIAEYLDLGTARIKNALSQQPVISIRYFEVKMEVSGVCALR
ncbi:hypothetical protein CFAM422_003105 [Trichoderma lentiforme]|uniref:Uncharacterized protein n=1 Tax=Trichoderma lentiforme TaxID=1567552 RepID=A0A9P5CHV2_9HYPO|nr:hypothetical protein CFAM422_003105 [Trichoderma lentiforme]